MTFFDGVVFLDWASACRVAEAASRDVVFPSEQKDHGGATRNETWLVPLTNGSTQAKAGSDHRIILPARRPALDAVASTAGPLPILLKENYLCQEWLGLFCAKSKFNNIDVVRAKPSKKKHRSITEGSWHTWLGASKYVATRTSAKFAQDRP